MKKVLATVVALGCCLYLPTAVLAGGGKKASDDMSRELQDLRDQLARQQAEIDMLKGQKSDPTLNTRLEALEKKKGYVMAANSFIDQVTIKGDFRVRYEYLDYGFNDSDDVNQEHFRSRFRLGGIWQNKAENWVVGAGVATGSASNPTSTNDSWGTTNSFDHSEFNLDYAFAKHTWNDYSMTLGQMENPYVTTWTMYDPDVRFTGLTLAYGAKEGVFATASAYGAQERILSDGGTNTSMLYMGQVGYKNKFSEKGKYTLAAGYQLYDQEFINQNNRLGDIDEDQYGLSIGDLYGDVTFPAGPMTMKLYGQVWMNFEADGDVGESQAVGINQNPDDNDLGWVLGLNANIEQFHFGYAYAYVEADSLYGYLSDADFGYDYTNKQGHRANVGYDITKNWAVDFNFFLVDRIEDIPDEDFDDKTTYQLDVSYKF